MKQDQVLNSTHPVQDCIFIAIYCNALLVFFAYVAKSDDIVGAIVDYSGTNISTGDANVLPGRDGGLNY